MFSGFCLNHINLNRGVNQPSWCVAALGTTTLKTAALQTATGTLRPTKTIILGFEWSVFPRALSRSRIGEWEFIKGDEEESKLAPAMFLSVMRDIQKSNRVG